MIREIALHNQKKLKNIQEIVKKVHRDKALTIMQMRVIIKKAKEGNQAAATRGTSMQRRPSPISPPKRRMNSGKLVQAHGVTTKPATLNKE
jgi:hypothetical protein